MLAFTEEGHRYTWNGVVVPSVTQALDVLDPDAFAKVPADTLEAARKRGRAVHRLVELDATKDLDEDSVAPALHPYLLGWRKFAAETGFTAMATELMLYSMRYGYAGRLDLLGEFARRAGRGTGVDAIQLDVKSGAIPKTAKPQTAAYAQLLTENGFAGKGLRRRALAIFPHGYQLSEPYTDPADLSDFLAALRITQRWRSR